MVLRLSHNFCNFIVGNQLYNTNYGQTEEACHRVHGRGGDGPQVTFKVDKDKQDHTRQDRGSVVAGHESFQSGIFLRDHWQEVGDIPQHCPHCREAFLSRRSGGSSDSETEPQLRHGKDQDGRTRRGAGPEDRMWSGPGGPGEMDAPVIGGAVPGRAGGAREQGHHPEDFKKNKLRPHKNTYWCIPATGSGEFVACMEDVLDVYERPYDPEYPVVCVDELPYEMHGEARDPLPAKPGSDTKTDFEYVRCGTCSVFGAIEPLTGKCIVEARGRRTKTDLAEFLSEVSGCYPDARRIILVWDNLNTHRMGSLYEAFEPARARELASRFEVHYTPKHGSWLNVAEILLNILTKQCLKRRLDSIDSVSDEIDKWVRVRNSMPTKIDWQFKTTDARIKLKRLYPDINTSNQ